MDNKDLKNIITNKETLNFISKVHEKIINSDEGITFKIFPLYIKYFLNEKVIASIYYKKGKTLNEGEIDIGLNLKERPEIEGCKDAKYMKDVNINFSFLFNSKKYSEDKLSNLIKLMLTS